MKVSRKFKENVTAWGFFFLSIAVVVLLVAGALCARTSHRSAPATEQLHQ